jgi:hypothetical protein
MTCISDSTELGLEALAAAESAKKDLETKLADTREATGPADDDAGEDGHIQRPPGSAGDDFSIQVEMGLAGTAKKNKIYQGLLVR